MLWFGGFVLIVVFYFCFLSALARATSLEAQLLKDAEKKLTPKANLKVVRTWESHK